jgi:transcriptional regulator with XRE-family HTH domain
MASTPVLELLGRTVKEIRLEQRMTQQQLADLAGLHRTFIISIEKGRQNLSAMTLIRLADALGVLPPELLRGFSRKVMHGLTLR